MRHTDRSFLFAGFLILATGLVAESATYLPVTDASLVDRSPIAVVGRVGAARAWGDSFTAYDVSVERVLKGSVSPLNISVAVPGNSTYIVPGMPRFSAGERVILFLESHEDGTYRIMELMLGAFKEVRVPGTSDTRAHRNLSGSLSLAGPQVEPARDFEAFASWIEARGSGGVQASSYLRAATETTADGVVEAEAPFTLLSNPPGRFTQFDTGGSVQWFLRPSTPPSTLAGGGATSFLVAMNAYNNEPSTIFNFTYGGTNSGITVRNGDGINAVLMNDPFNEIAGSFDCSSGGVLAIGGFSFGSVHTYKGTTHGTISEGNIVTQNGSDCAFDNFAENFGAQVFAHELGHVVGLGHSCDEDDTPTCASTPSLNEALMRPFAHNENRGTNFFRADDVAGLVRLYE